MLAVASGDLRAGVVSPSVSASEGWGAGEVGAGRGSHTPSLHTLPLECPAPVSGIGGGGQRYPATPYANVV